LTPARKAWIDLREEATPQGIKRTAAYLGALRDLANAVACFSGAPLAERRLVHELPARASAAKLPQLSADFVHLFTSSEVNDENFAAWADNYHDLFDVLKENPNAPASMQPFRRAYYEKAIRALYPNNPAGALWLMFYTWTQAAMTLPRAEQAFKDWTAVSKQLELDTKNIAQRLDGLDHLLDTAEEAAERLTA
jgi:hypothetical protein